MATNLNTFPYYDDFSDEKGFHRILFKPGFAVQARELTQMQTILQDQIRRFGNHVFKDGSVVFGCAESSNFAVPYVKVQDTDDDGAEISDAAFALPSGYTLIGQNQGVRATIKLTAAGSVGDSPNLKTLFVQYTSAGADNTTTTFGVGETLEVLETGQTFVVAGPSETPLGVGSLFSVGDGIVYANGNFVRHALQTVILGRYTATPTVRVGFVVNETIVNVDDDPSLRDPAQGSFNYTAPGADRFKLETQIVVIADGDEVPEGFYLLFDVENGRVKRKYNATQYAELAKTMARRTYDESGDYTVRPFPLIIREHLNNGSNNGRYTEAEGGDAGKLVVAVEPGKAYVKGFEHELWATDYLDTPKAFGDDHEDTKQNQPITTGYGSYVTVNSVAGVWPINSAATVNLVQSPSTTIGTAKVRDIEFVSGSTYNLYLYDIAMTAAFGLVDTITYAAGNATATVVDTTAVLQESGQLASIFEAPYANLKTIADASYVYRKVITSISASATTVTATLSGEAWAFSSASVASNRSNDVMVVKESDGSILGITAATVSGSTLTITLQTSLGGATNLTVIGLVRKTIAQNTKQLRTDRYVKFNTVSHANTSSGPYCLGYYDAVAIEEVWSATASGSGDTTFPTDPSVDNNWTNVTDLFTLDTGQRDATYSLAYLVPKTTQTSKKLIVKLSYFLHGTSSGYFSVDSYPLPAENAAPTSTEIGWEDLPIYTSNTGKAFDLRNCVDFRPTAALTATDSTTIAGATLNPSATISGFLTGFTHPASSEEFLGDITVHLPRYDRIVLDAEGNFRVINGVPSENPIKPRQPENAMTLGFAYIAPYPSLSPTVAKEKNKPQFASRVSLNDNRRFTMRDIGDISRRIERLEYYTSLSLLEQNTANLLIANSDGEDRFKNGILVDAFVGHNVGNVFDPAYHCSINEGELRPFYLIDNVDFVVDGLTTAVRKAADAAIVVRQLQSAGAYTVGSTITSSSSATGVIVHVVPLATSPGYRWVRLYLSGVTGTFGENNTISQTSITGTITYDQLSTTVLATSLRPDLVSVPTEGSLITLPYDHTVYAQNPYASKTRNAVSQLLFVYNGNMTLNPPVDVWTDTARLPEIQVNQENTLDNWESMDDAWGTQWGSWETAWQGATAIEVLENHDVIDGVGVGTREIIETTVQRQERVGTTFASTPDPVRTDLGSRIVSQSLIPFMRSVVVNFSANNLKPNSRVYAYFDNINVSDHCRTTGAFGTALFVDANGNLNGQFRVPANTFTVGTKTFLVCDNPTNPRSTGINTIASAGFTASGLSVVEQNTVISTQQPSVTTNQQIETRNVVERRTIGVETFTFNPDPIAQTFTVTDHQNGILLSKIDVYFQKKSTTAGITLQIREVSNGYPGETIVPYSTVTIAPKDVNVSEDATSPTPFVFSSPVYLKNDTEYCFVLLPAGNDENYEVWVSELGENQIGTTQRIDKQPYAGVLFVSANNRTWTAIQSEDIKFSLYRCVFDTDDTGTVDLVNAAIDYVTLSSATEDFVVGDSVIYVNAGLETGRGTIKYWNSLDEVFQVSVVSGAPTVADDVVVKGDALSGLVTASAPTTLLGSGTAFTTDVAVGDILMYGSVIIGEVDTITSDTELDVVNTIPVAFSNQTIHTTKRATVATIDKKLVTAIAPTLGFLDFNNTDIAWTHKLHSYAGVDPVDYLPLVVTGTTELPVEKGVFSSSEDTETFCIRATLGTSASHMSPVVDTQKLGCVIIGNSVNNLTTNETTNNGAAISKYISRRVVLSDGQESEDLRVYLTSTLPSGASVKVYAKLLNDTDPAVFEDRPWLELVETAPVNNTGFKEYVYTLPTGDGSTLAGSLTGDGYEYSNIYTGFKAFAVKIVLLSSNAASIPRVRDMRAVALLL